jgi:hypothetical protein
VAAYAHSQGVSNPQALDDYPSSNGESMETTCILAKGFKDSAGYAHKAGDRAHRRYYEHTKGPIPKGLVVMHICHNKICINPDHLIAVTPQLNSAYDGYCSRGRGSSSGVTGVTFHDGRYWWAYYTEFGERVVLYRGKDFFEAVCARKSWEVKKLRELPKEIYEYAISHSF